MNAQALEAWVALYAACGILAALTAVAVAARIILEVAVGRLRPAETGWRGGLWFAPKLWVRWQLAYLSAAPVLLLILMLFASHLGFDALLAV